MRIIFLIICFTTSSSCFCQCDTTSQLSQKDSLIRSFIKTLKTESYKGEMIGNVLKKDIIKEYCDYFYIQKVVGIFAGIQLRYKGFISIRIYVAHSETVGFGRSASKWDFEKVKNCKVYKIEVVDYFDLP